MKAELLKSLLLSCLILSPLILTDVKYYLLSALLSTVIISIVKISRIESVMKKIIESPVSLISGNLRKELLLKEKGAIGVFVKNINGIAVEIEERLKVVKGEKDNMEAIIRNMSEGLMLIDKRGKIILSNSAINKIFGIESVMEGKTLIETLRNAELMEITGDVVENETKVVKEVEITYPKEIYLMVTALPFYSYGIEGKVSGVVLTFHDITRIKQLEEIRKDFVANVSHELKTPITAIKGFAETLLEGAIDDREHAYKFLETIKNHSERLNSLVNDLLTLSSIEMRDIKIEKINVNLNNVIDSVFTTLRGKAEIKGLYLNKSISQGFQEIYTDKDRLVQILINLVDNGIKFTDHGGVIVGSEEKDGKGILYVEDTGAGIEKRHLSRLGERFYRVDSARSRELGGTGLGLAIVKHLVMAHGWKMEIDSTRGRGTKVKIIIPPSIKI